MNSKYFLVGGGLLLVLVLGVIFPRPGQIIVEKVKELGAFPGDSVYYPISFHDGVTIGGGKRATSTDDTTATLLASDMDNETLLEFTPNVASITLTLPATSTLRNFVPNAGDVKNLMVCNATSTAATPFTLATGAGMNLHQATSTTAIKTGDCAVLTFVRATDTDIETFYDLGY